MTISAKQMARQIGVTPRQFRRFLRTRSSSDKAVGRGQRYEFPEDEADRVKAEYHYWRQQVKEKKEQPAMELGSKPQHHPRKYMTNHSGSVVFVFTCCSIHREFTSRNARDKVAAEHNQEYEASRRSKAMK